MIVGAIYGRSFFIAYDLNLKGDGDFRFYASTELDAALHESAEIQAQRVIFESLVLVTQMGN